MKPFALIIVLALVLSACNDLNDLRPVDPGKEIPEAAVKVVKAKFPKAEELVFRPILEDKIWEVRLKSDADRYTSLVDYGKMWETFKISPDGTPVVLTESLKKTAFGDGTLSGYSTSYFATTAPNKLIYNYKGENYSFEWAGIYPNTNSSGAFDPYLYRITTYDINDLPAAIKDTIQGRSGMKFVVGNTWVKLDDTRRYYVTATQQMTGRADRISMLFDDKGKLQWSTTDHSQTGVPDASWELDTVPAGIQQYLAATPEFAGFEYERKSISNVRGMTSYYIRVGIGGVSKCELYFDQNFNMLHKRYVVILY